MEKCPPTGLILGSAAAAAAAAPCTKPPVQLSPGLNYEATQKEKIYTYPCTHMHPCTYIHSCMCTHAHTPLLQAGLINALPVL